MPSLLRIQLPILWLWRCRCHHDVVVATPPLRQSPNRHRRHIDVATLPPPPPSRLRCYPVAATVTSTLPTPPRRCRCHPTASNVTPPRPPPPRRWRWHLAAAGATPPSPPPHRRRRHLDIADATSTDVAAATVTLPPPPRRYRRHLAAAAATSTTPLSLRRRRRRSWIDLWSGALAATTTTAWSCSYARRLWAEKTALLRWLRLPLAAWCRTLRSFGQWPLSYLMSPGRLNERRRALWSWAPRLVALFWWYRIASFVTDGAAVAVSTLTDHLSDATLLVSSLKTVGSGVRDATYRCVSAQTACMAALEHHSMVVAQQCTKVGARRPSVGHPSSYPSRRFLKASRIMAWPVTLLWHKPFLSHWLRLPTRSCRSRSRWVARSVSSCHDTTPRARLVSSRLSSRNLRRLLWVPPARKAFDLRSERLRVRHRMSGHCPISLRFLTMWWRVPWLL